MSSTGTSLRACELKDLAQLVQLEKDSFPERPYTMLDFAYFMMVARQGFVVASEDGRVVGYVIATSQGREGWIQSIAVLPGSRRRGTGEMLLRSALDRLAGRGDRVLLLVDVSNDAAIRLYRKLSFEETGRVVSKYYPNGGDAMEMTRKLEPSRTPASP